MILPCVVELAARPGIGGVPLQALAQLWASFLEMVPCVPASPVRGGCLRRVQVGKFSMMANSRARAQDDAEGLVKILADAKTDKILGAHIMGPSAGEMIHEVRSRHGRPSPSLHLAASPCGCLRRWEGA